MDSRARIGSIARCSRPAGALLGVSLCFHKTILQEFYQVTFCKKLYRSMEELQQDLDAWIEHYNTERTHEGKMCCGRTPFATMLAGKEIWNEKVAALTELQLTATNLAKRESVRSSRDYYT